MRLKVEKGDVFGYLTIEKEVERYRLPSGQTNRVFECICRCGNIKKVRLSHLRHNKITSCGCKTRLLKKSEYTNEERYIVKIYKAIHDRCKPNAIDSHIYFKRNIKVCEEWSNDIHKFVVWAKENGLKKGTQIDRIDNNKGYCSSNCRVVSPEENANNRRNTFYINYKGKKYPISQLLREKGLEDNISAIRSRILRGWEHEKAIDTPIAKQYRKKIKKIQ